MKKRYRLLIVLILAAVGFYFLLPSIQWYGFVPGTQKSIADSSRNQVKVYAQERADSVVTAITALAASNPNAPLPKEYGYLIQAARSRYASAGLPAPSTWTMKTVLDAYSSRAGLSSAIENHYRTEILGLQALHGRTVQLGLDLRGGTYVVLQADFSALEKEMGRKLTASEKADKMSSALYVLRNRIDQFGLTQPVIEQQGTDKIVVEIPGAQNLQTVQSFVMGKGLLTFHIVDQQATAAVNTYESRTGAVIFNAAGKVIDPNAQALVPKGDELLGVYGTDAYGLDSYRGPTVVHSQVGLSGQEIKSATVTADPITGRPLVDFFLTPQGGNQFYQLTSANVGQSLAVVLDNKVKAAATIQTAIRDSVQITGFNQQEAQNLALVLRTGSLPVPLSIISEQQIGASLGEDAIHKGIEASILGLGMVFLFMLLYYRRAGINAIIAQLLNLYFIVAILSAFSFTLTLSAIAGLVLNVGMAVDANVLIFERMKEEMRLGKPTPTVVKAGFSRAFWAIADSNITTIIAALVLSQLAKGNIQGFAVTLMVGNLCTLFTAVFVSRLIFDFNVEVLKTRRIVLSWRKQEALSTT